MTLTVERLKEVLHYDPETGRWTWLIRASTSRPIGSTAGCTRGDGYRVIRVDGVLYPAHRLAVLYMTSAWPPVHVDHENVTPGDDRWENLRPATRAQNQANQPRNRTNTSGFKGACWDKRRSKWAATIRVAGRSKFLGYYSTAEVAHAAYVAAARTYRGEFARVA